MKNTITHFSPLLRTLHSALRTLHSLPTLLLVLLSSFFILHSPAAVPLRWTVETSRVQPVAFDAVRGETLSLEASFKSYGTDVSTSNMTAFLCWQTNGMAGAWWVTNAVTSGTSASVLFTPEMDPGASTVHAFLGLSTTNQTIQQSNNPTISYRALFTLRFRPGPGADPNALPLPTQVLDFDKVTLRNEKWYRKDAVDEATNSTLTAATAYTDAATNAALSSAMAYTDASTNGLASASITNGLVTASITNGLVTASITNGLASLASLASLSSTVHSDIIAATNGVSSFAVAKTGAQKMEGPLTVGTVLTSGTMGINSLSAGQDNLAEANESAAIGHFCRTKADSSYSLALGHGAFAIDSKSFVWNGNYSSSTGSYQSKGTGTFCVNPRGGASGFYVGASSLTGMLSEYYPKAQGDAWSAYWSGDDVRVTVTNYDSAANIPSLYLEQKTNEVALATNLFRTVWREMAHWEAFLGTNWNWNATWTGFSSWRESLQDELADKADRAWGFYDSHTGAYAPDGYTQISSEHIIIAKGMGYQKTVTTDAEVWVLTADEPYEPTGVSTNGGFQLKDGDGNVQFEIVKGDKATVAAQANATAVTNSTLYVVYNVIATEHPTCEVCLTLTNAAWKAETASDCPATVSWSGSSGRYVAAITPKSSTSSCFAKATYQRGGDTYINNRCAVGMSKIVLNGTTYTLGTATIDGHTVLTLTPAN